MKQKANVGLVVGVTGPSGAGKSEACRVLGGLGFVRLDVDKIAKSLYKKGNPAYGSLVKIFGSQIVGPGGHIHRKKLAHLVFSEKTEKIKMDRVLFPLINKAVQENIILKRRIGKRNICLDMAVLFDSGADRFCDKVILILDSPMRRVARLRQRGLDLDRARAQARCLKFGPSEKLKASLLLVNSGSRSRFVKTVESFALQIFES